MTGLSNAAADHGKLGSLKAELTRVGDLIEAGKRRLEGLHVDEAEESRLRENIPLLQAEERTLIDSINRLKGAEVQAVRGTQKAAGAFQRVDEAYRTTSELHGNVTDRKNRAVRQVEVLKGDAAVIAAGNRERGREEISRTDPAIVSANAVLAKVRSEIAVAKRQLTSMASKRETHAKLTNSIGNLNDRSAKLERQIADGERQLKKTESSIAAVESEIAQKRADFEKMCSEKNAGIDAREKDLMDREGDLGRVRNWIIEKGGLLKQAKREIESFHGKTLNHIIIPELE